MSAANSLARTAACDWPGESVVKWGFDCLRLDDSSDEVDEDEDEDEDGDIGPAGGEEEEASLFRYKI